MRKRTPLQFTVPWGWKLTRFLTRRKNGQFKNRALRQINFLIVQNVLTNRFVRSANLMGRTYVRCAGDHMTKDFMIVKRIWKIQHDVNVHTRKILQEWLNHRKHFSKRSTNHNRIECYIFFKNKSKAKQILSKFWLKIIQRIFFIIMFPELFLRLLCLLMRIISPEWRTLLHLDTINKRSNNAALFKINKAFWSFLPPPSCYYTYGCKSVFLDLVNIQD